MLGDQRLMCFVATTDAERAKDFYRRVLGLQLVSDDPFALVFDVGGTSLRVQKAGPFTAQPFTQLGWEVSDIRATLRGLKEHGVEPLRYPQMQQDELGVWNAGEAEVAWFHDPDKNVLSVMSRVRKANK